MPATCLSATRAITNASQNWSPDDLKLNFAAAAGCRGALIRHFASPSNCRAKPPKPLLVIMHVFTVAIVLALEHGMAPRCAVP
jgi:hypothetical protein